MLNANDFWWMQPSRESFACALQHILSLYIVVYINRTRYFCCHSKLLLFPFPIMVAVWQRNTVTSLYIIRVSLVFRIHKALLHTPMDAQMILQPHSAIFFCIVVVTYFCGGANPFSPSNPIKYILSQYTWIILWVQSFVIITVTYTECSIWI